MKGLILWTCLVAGLFLISPIGVGAQDPGSPEATLIRAGRVFDSERGVMLPARDILLRGGLIEAVGEDLAAPAGARVLDLRAYTVLPGLIDAHTHLLLEVEPYAGIEPEVITKQGDVLRALRGAAHAREYLHAGITTVRDLGNAGLFADVALKRAIDEGDLPGPRMYVSGPGLSAEGGQFEGLQFRHRHLASEEYRIVRGAEDARLAVRENVTHGADLIKIYANNTPNPGYLSTEEMRAIVEEAHLLGVKVTAHATNDRAVRRAVDAGVDAIEHGYFISDSILALLAKRRVPLVPTTPDLDTAVISPRARERAGIPLPPGEQLAPLLARAEAWLRQVASSGTTLVAGSDMYWDVGLPRGEAAKRVLFAYRQAGIEPAQILQAATINAARLIGEERLGRLAPGAYADLVAVEGNPLEEFGAIERVRLVMKEGKIIREER